MQNGDNYLKEGRLKGPEQMACQRQGATNTVQYMQITLQHKLQLFHSHNSMTMVTSHAAEVISSVLYPLNILPVPA